MLVSRIPPQILQGDSATWTDSAFADESGNSFNNANSTLKYTISGPSAPLVLTATASGLDWTTTLTTTQSTALKPGTYWWQMQAFATSVRVTAAQGELIVKPDLALAGSGYDGRSVAEIALAQARAAYSTFSATGGVVKMYHINNREMMFQDLHQIREQVDYWSGQVAAEKSAADGSKSRRLHIRFDRIR